MENPPPVYRVYRLNWWQRGFALTFLALSTFFVFGVWRGVFFNQEEPRPFLMAMTTIFMLVGAGLTANAFGTTVIFTADAVELRSILGYSRLPLNKIRGRREFVARGDEGGGTRYLVLVSNDDRLPKIQFMKDYTFDESFFRWFYELPDLDADDKKVPKDANFGLV